MLLGTRLIIFTAVIGGLLFGILQFYDPYDRMIVMEDYKDRVGTAELPTYRLIHRQNLLQDSISQVSWSANSKRLFRASEHEKLIYELNGADVDLLFEDQSEAFSTSTSTILHPNGQWFFEKVDLHEWQIVDIATRQVIHSRINEWFGFRDVQINGSGDRMLVQYKDNIVLYDTSDWSIVWRHEHGRFFENSISFSPDNQTFSLVNSVWLERTELEIWDYRTFKQIGSFEISNVYMGDSAISPDGTILATAANTNFVLRPGQENYVDEPHGIIEFTHVAPGPLMGTSAGVVPDDVNRGRWVQSITFSADGQVVAAAFDHNHVDLVHVADRQFYARLPMPDDYIFDVEFSPNGQYLAAVGPTSLYIWQREATP